MKRLCADIHKKIGEFKLDVRIESDAKRIGILGASGSGKSMTLRSIAGIEDIYFGHIESDGRVLYDSKERINLRPQERSVGYMFQNYALFPTMSVESNVMAGIKGTTKERKAKAHDILRRFGMSDCADRLPDELSGGQQQRVALARIMLTEPSLILLDEPYAALDGHLRDRMQVEMLEMLDDYNGQVLMVSHSRDELYRFSEELFVISEGHIIRSGRTEDVFKDPIFVEAASLTGCKNFSRIRKTSKAEAELTDWGIKIDLKKEIPDWTTHIGYRAHYFEPVWGSRQDNCIKFNLARIDNLPFEKNYYIIPEGVEKEGINSCGAVSVRNNEADAAANHEDEVAMIASENLICWFVQGEEQRKIEEQGLPDYLRLSEEAILFLR